MYVCMYDTFKNNATICKVCVPLFDKKSCHTFMVCAESTGIWNCDAFLPNAPQFGERATFSRQKAPQCRKRQELRHSTRRHTAAWPSKCSAFGGRKVVTCCHVYKCRCDTFVVFFLTLIVYVCMYIDWPV